MQSENWSGGSLVRLAASRVQKRRVQEEGGDPPAPTENALAVPAASPVTVGPLGAGTRADHAPHVSVSAVPKLREYLEAFVESELDSADEEIVREHLRICAECEGYVDGLRAGRGARFRALAAANALIARFDPSADRPQHALPAAPSAPVVTARPRKPMLLFACASTCVALFICVTAVPIFQQIRALRSHVGNLQKNNAALRQDAEAGRSAADQITVLKQETDSLKKRYDVAQSTLNRMSVDVEDIRTQDTPKATVMAPMPVMMRPLVAPPPASAIISDGGSILTIGSGGRLRGLDNLPPDLKRYADTAVRSGRLPLPNITRFAPPNSGFAALCPAGAMTELDRPTFRWRPLDNGAPYAISVIDSTGAIVARGQGILGNEWSATTPLQRGKTYTWEVVARGVSAPGGQVMKRTGRFTVLEQAQADGISRLRTTHADSNLVVGLACAKAGLLESAAKEFQVLAEANPGSPVVQKLSRQLSPWRMP
jgi:hypothetical protein